VPQQQANELGHRALSAVGAEVPEVPPSCAWLLLTSSDDDGGYCFVSVNCPLLNGAVQVLVPE
jgi:hypothetical protein